MQVIETATGELRNAIVLLVEKADFKMLTKSHFFFNWKGYRESMSIYKLALEDDGQIVGVVGIIDVAAEGRVEIKLLASAIENVGKHKKYDRIVGCLIAFVCRYALLRYGPEACVSLVPKTKLKAHYMDRYYMHDAGWQLFLDGIALIKLMNEYL